MCFCLLMEKGNPTRSPSPYGSKPNSTGEETERSGICCAGRLSVLAEGRERVLNVFSPRAALRSGEKNALSFFVPKYQGTFYFFCISPLTETLAENKT